MSERTGAPFVHLEVRADAVKSSVWLNNVPLYENDDGRPRFIQTLVNEWVVDGTNHLKVLLAAHEDPAKPRPPQFACKLARGTFGMEAPPSDVVTDYTYSPAKGPLSPTEPKPVFTKSVEIEHPYERWKWQGAAKRQALTADDRVQIHRLTMQLHRMLSMRNARGFAGLVGLRNEEMSRAYDLDAGGVQGDLVAALQGMFSQPGWALAPLTDPEAELDLRLLADGRVVEVRHRNGGAPLRGTDGAKAFGYPLMVSLLHDDEWTVVR